MSDERPHNAMDEPVRPADPDPPEALPYADPATPDDRAGDFADELDGLRIRQLAAMKRGAYRARSFAIIGVVASFVVAVKLAMMTVNHVQARGWDAWPVGFALFSLAGLMLGSFFSRRVMDLTREINTPAPLPPPPPGGPDFSTLSDGSQQWKNLEDIR